MSPKDRNPELSEKISQMRLTLAPLVHTETCQPPPDFPTTLLQLFLLTEEQLDIMARFYSQSTPSALTTSYPSTMNWNKEFLAKPTTYTNVPDDCRLTNIERHMIKMRMFAKFIGMRGAETPTWEYERQIEILEAQIKRSIEEEACIDTPKIYQGPQSFY
jgi:hypothetical protein